MVGHNLAKVAATVFLVLASVRQSAAAPEVPAEVPAAPHARIFTSESGQVFLKIMPGKDGQPAMGTVTALAADGTEEVLWHKPLARAPLKAFVSERMAGGAYVVALDSGWGFTPSTVKTSGMVVYNEQGSIVRDFAPPQKVEPPRTIPVTDPEPVLQPRPKNHLIAESARFETVEAKVTWSFVQVTYFENLLSRAQIRSIVTSRVMIDLKTGEVSSETKSVRVGGLDRPPIFK